MVRLASQGSSAHGAGGRPLLTRIIPLLAGAVRRPVTLAFLWKGINAIASLLAAMLLARVAGAEVLGHYALALATAAVAMTVGLRGLDTVLVRVVAGDLRERAFLAARGALRLVYRHVALSILLVSAALLALTLVGGLARWMGADQVSLAVAGLGVVALAALRLTIMTLRSFDRPVLAQWVEALPSLIFLLLVAATAISGRGFSGPLVLLLYFSAQLVSAAVGYRGVRRIVRSWNLPPGRGEAPALRPLLLAGFPIMLTVLLHVSDDWFLLAAATRLLSAADAGAMRIALQLMIALAMVATVMESYLAARLAGDLRVGRSDLAWSRYRKAVLVSLVLVGPVVLLLVIAPRPIVTILFGAEFAPAAPAVALMALGQLVNVATGPAGLVLAMAGQERLLLIVILAGSGALVLVTLALVPTLGLSGLAIGYASAYAVRKGLALLLASRIVRPGRHLPVPSAD
jgi:O-antigen/teichoic acid export membrane protein